MGLRRGWRGDNACAFMQWVRDCLIAVPDWVIGECTPSFDDARLVELIGAQYDVRSTIISPHLLGLPVRRYRKYMFMVKKDSLKWLADVQKKGVGKVLRELFFSTPDVSGDVLFRAPADFVERSLEERACKRALPSRRPNGTTWHGRQLLNPGQRLRLGGYEGLLRRRGLIVGQAAVHVQPHAEPMVRRELVLLHAGVVAPLAFVEHAAFS